MSRNPRIYDYDRSLVPDVKCNICSERIGDEPYLEFQIVARFGQMFFIHKRCDNDGTGYYVEPSPAEDAQ